MYRLGILVLVSVVLLSPFLINDVFGVSQTIVKEVDQSLFDSEVLQDDDEIFFTCDANTAYAITMTIIADINPSNDFKSIWIVPSGTTILTTDLDMVPDNFRDMVSWTTDFVSNGDSSATQLMRQRAVVNVAGTAGTCQFQWAMNDNFGTNTIVVKNGTSLEIKQQGITLEGVNGLAFVKIVKATDEIIQSIEVPQNDDELFFTATANKAYSFMLDVYLDSPSGQAFATDWTVPSGATGRVSSVQLTSGSPSGATQDLLAEDGHSTNGNIQQLVFFGKIEIASTGGLVNFQWSQDASGAFDTTVFKGSKLIVWEEGTTLASGAGEQGIQGIQGVAGSAGSKGDKGDAGGSPVGDPVGDPISEEDIIESVLAQIEFVQPNIVESAVQTFFEFSVVDASLNQLTLNSLVTNERLGIRWSSGQDMVVTSAIPASSPFTITFETFPAVKRGSGAVISTDFVLYNIGVPNRNCTTQIRSDCVEKVRYEIPVTINGIVGGLEVTDTGTITIDLSEGTFDPILLLILSMFFIPLAGVMLQRSRGRSARIPVRRIVSS